MRPDPIGDIYDAAVDSAAFARISEIICEAADGGTAVSYISCGGQVSDVVPHNVAPDLLAPYDAYFHHVDPMLATILTRANWTEGRFGDDLMPERDYAETEFYRDFARPIGIFRMVACGIPVAPGCTFITGAHRPSGTRRFRRRDKARFDALLPHLQRSLQIRHRFDRLRLSQIGFRALEGLDEGIVVCDGGGHVLFANTAAESLVRAGSGLILGRSGLAAARREQSSLLSRHIRNAGEGGAGGTMQVMGPEGGKLFVMVAPLPRRLAETGRSDPRRLVLVAIRSTDAKPGLDETTLVHLFDLSPAEAQVALALAAGHSLARIVAERRVSYNTVRSQLASVLRKTETAGQRDLVRLLGLLPTTVHQARKL